MRRLFGNIGCILALCSVMVSCVALNPVSAAKTTSQKAYALYGSFVVYEELDAALIVQPTISVELKAKLRQVDSEAKPVADSLLDTARTVAQIQREVAQGQTSQDKLTGAQTQLDALVLEATPKVQALIDAVTGGK